MNIKKHMTLTGISNISWKDAISKTIIEASKSISCISEIKILEQFAKIDNNKIIEYYAVVDLTINVNIPKE